MPSIGLNVKLNQIQTRTNLGHKPQWKKVVPNSKFVGHSTEIIRQSKIKGPLQTWKYIMKELFFHFLRK